ncbi:MAG TPA: hypothetical protein VM925_22480 [Labilithrix sp.]|nr:hypothetical protein [Labilithrix sp.]
MRTGRPLALFLVLAALATSAIAGAQPAPSAVTAPVSKPASQGVAVLGMGASRDDAFGLARAVYASSLRPRHLDELRARILAGDPAPPAASREVRDLAELRASITGDDAASRRLLSSIAQQLGVRALLVVSRHSARDEKEKAIPAETLDAGAPDGSSPEAADRPSPAAGSEAVDAGVDRARPATVTARLFLADSGEFDAARYEPETTAAGEGTSWRGTVTSLSGRFPPAPGAATAQLQGPPPKLTPGEKESRPFYTSGWLWGAVGAAALLGGFFFFATQDTSSDPIHLQMRVPR